MTDLCGVAYSPRDVRLRREGWVKQFTCGEPRLSEAIELFEEIGKEIRLEQMSSEDQLMGAECDSCFISCGDNLKTIWTRTKE